MLQKNLKLHDECWNNSKTSTKLTCEVAQNTYLDWKLQNIFTVENARIRRLRNL
jgi:hypothetical protein